VELITAGPRETDPAKLKAAYSQLNDLLLDEASSFDHRSRRRTLLAKSNIPGHRMDRHESPWYVTPGLLERVARPYRCLHRRQDHRSQGISRARSRARANHPAIKQAGFAARTCISGGVELASPRRVDARSARRSGDRPRARALAVTTDSLGNPLEEGDRAPGSHRHLPPLSNVPGRRSTAVREAPGSVPHELALSRRTSSAR